MSLHGTWNGRLEQSTTARANHLYLYLSNQKHRTFQLRREKCNHILYKYAVRVD